MLFKLLDLNDKNTFEKDIIEMLVESDEDFVPPLSKRSSTLDKNFSTASTKNGILSYYLGMKEQQILGAFEDGELIGFVSYRENFVSEEIASSELPNIYVSTLVLSKKARGKGVTKKMYAYLFRDPYADRKVFTRTWSANGAHTKILIDFGFFEIIRKENDRGIGIDTVYYKKEAALSAALL